MPAKWQHTAWTTAPENAPDKPEYVTLNFENGIPVGLNGEIMNGVNLIGKLHELGCKHGVGRIEHMEDRAIGLKSRETYEVPAALILIKAHRDLEKYVCTKHENSFKTIVDQRTLFGATSLAELRQSLIDRHGKDNEAAIHIYSLIRGILYHSIPRPNCTMRGMPYA